MCVDDHHQPAAALHLYIVVGGMVRDLPVDHRAEGSSV
jgi:hypothetical protein